jgi:hypothetical protein
MRWCVWLAVLALAGCNPADEKKYTPADTTARQALEAALGKWRDGQAKPEKFTLGQATVEVQDQAWASGQKLQGFEVVSEEPPAGAGPRVYAVKLKTPKGEQTVKYYVVGIDPLWVFAEPDYKKQMGS